MHVFISKALHKILREAPKKHTQLRTACQEVIGERSAASDAPLRPGEEPRSASRSPPLPLPLLSQRS